MREKVSRSDESLIYFEDKLSKMADAWTIEEIELEYKELKAVLKGIYFMLAGDDSMYLDISNKIDKGYAVELKRIGSTLALEKLHENVRDKIGEAPSDYEISNWEGIGNTLLMRLRSADGFKPGIVDELYEKLNASIDFRKAQLLTISDTKE